MLTSAFFVLVCGQMAWSWHVDKWHGLGGIDAATTDIFKYPERTPDMPTESCPAFKRVRLLPRLLRGQVYWGLIEELGKIKNEQSPIAMVFTNTCGPYLRTKMIEIKYKKQPKQTKENKKRPFSKEIKEIKEEYWKSIGILLVVLKALVWIYGKLESLRVKSKQDMKKSAETEMKNAAKQFSDSSNSDPTEISNRLAKVDYEINKLDGEVDKSLADLHQTGILGHQDRAEFLCKISQTYLSLGKFKKAEEVAIQGIGLLNESSSSKNYSQATLIKLLCCAGEASMESEKIAEYYKTAESLLHSLPDSSLEYKDHNVCVENLGLHLSRFAKRHGPGNSVAKKIGSDGGVLKLNDCMIYFPKDSHSKETLHHAATDVCSTDAPEGKVPITPILRLSPNMQLLAPATIKIRTWFMSTHPAHVQIYFKHDENAKWEEVPQRYLAQLYGNNTIEFETTKFCIFCAFYNADQVANVSLRVACLLFYDARRKLLANRIVPACDTYIDAENQSMRRLESVCITNPELEVRVGHQIVVNLENIEDTQQRDPILRVVQITMNFARRQIHEPMEFRLPRDCSGFVDFHHVVSQYEDQVLIGGPIRHTEDRISLDYGAPAICVQNFNIGDIYRCRSVHIGGKGNVVVNLMDGELPHQ